MRATLEGRLRCHRLQHHRLWCHRLLRWCHPCASHSHLPGVSHQPCTSRQCSRQVNLQGWESPLTPPLTNMLPLVVRMPMATGGREHEADMITPGLPVTPGECERGPPSGRPVSRRLIRWVSAPPEHLTMSLQLQHLKVPHPNMAVV